MQSRARGEGFNPVLSCPAFHKSVQRAVDRLYITLLGTTSLYGYDITGLRSLMFVKHRKTAGCPIRPQTHVTAVKRERDNGRDV